MEKIRFVLYARAADMHQNVLGGLGGFFANGMRWENYLGKFKEQFHPRLEALRQAIIEREIRCTGSEHQNCNLPTAPVFEDGTAATYSFRAWGDLMAAVWSSHDNKDYSYMDFYC